MKALLWIVGVVCLFVALVGSGLVIRYWLAGPAGAVDAVEQIQSGANRISAYNHFFDLCAGVRADEIALEAQSMLRDVTTDPFQLTRVNTNMTGLQGHRAGLIEEYNANARKDYTSGQFRDSDLPYRLPTGMWEKGVSTSCGS